jgi:hypothetical protein
MENQINNVCLSFQCPMPWTSMKTISNKERFCSQCHLAVTDFTNATQEEFDEKLKTSSGRVCGRFKRSQMNADYLTRIAAAVVMTSAIACTPEPTFQPPQIATPVENVIDEEEIFLGDIKFLPDSLEEEFMTGVIVTFEEDSVDEE